MTVAHTNRGKSVPGMYKYLCGKKEAHTVKQTTRKRLLLMKKPYMDAKISRTKPRAKGKISLEEYLYFIDSRNHDRFSINYLNQIMAMNGFRKLHGHPKKVVADAVNALDLIDLSRLTLQENISPHAFIISLEDAIKDLAELNWHECCATSILTLSSCKENSASSTQHSPSIQSAKRSNNIPKSKAPKLISLPGSANPSSCASANTDECTRSLNPKRKR